MIAQPWMVEWFLTLPLWLPWFVAGGPDAIGPAVGVAFLAIIGLWSGVFIRWKRDAQRSKLVGLFLVAVVVFPVVDFLLMVEAFGVSPRFSLLNQFLIVVQSYLSLSVLTHCEAFWRHRERAAYITAALTTLIGLLIWMITGFCYELTRQ